MRFLLDLLGIVVADLRLKFRSDSWRFDGVIWIRTFASFSSSFSSCLFMRTGILTEQRAHRSSGCRCASQAAHTPARPSSWCQRAVVRRGTASGGVHLQPVCGGAQALARCPREGQLASRPASSRGRPSSNPPCGCGPGGAKAQASQQYAAQDTACTPALQWQALAGSPARRQPHAAQEEGSRRPTAARAHPAQEKQQSSSFSHAGD